ncbi:MAG TPA: NADH-quinone oxidoreductase subunit NuoF [Firmicutes bacterium]|jgi:NADH:ubiquinone oxidoreductase subunit F (NADH-binding)/(2Fe-2S) ferredoxin|nr:NADH-quinone oxidoreductase subunit NuoF [Bacillota bacterium]
MSYFRAHVLVCAGTPCMLKGAGAVKDALCREIERAGLQEEVRVVETGCLGPCDDGPVIVVYPEGVMYSKLKPEEMSRIVQQHLLKGRVVEDLVYRAEKEKAKPVVSLEEQGYLDRQYRIVLRNCGRIDPDSIEEYIANGGYEALGKALTTMTPEQVVATVKDSGLRGRGGAGFPTGLKWSFTAPIAADQKYIICNADEGEPGTFKDRLILEGDPHSIIEAMAIAGYAVGADQGIVYIRGEYHLSIERLQRAAARARELGLLGKDIFGTGFNFDLQIRTGAGAYVCGEETALIESLEGKRGEPRLKPPYPGVAGLWGKPTVVNNVETLANIPPIILKGAEWFRGIGTEKTPGTKVFTMLGDITNQGLIEVPMGITLREVIYGVGGGIPNGRGFKLAQTGGTSGGCLPKEFLDLPMDYDSLAEAGSALGSGALLVIDDSHCIVDVLRSFMKFFQHESCGQCTPCREGTARLYQLFSDLAAGKAGQDAVQLIKELCQTMQLSSLCGLGQSAPNGVVTALQYFEEEIQKHVAGECPAGVCRISMGSRAV